tara:strand:- start:70 stop:183 length:114 start_codon:yes stop_codon:yes gene_type:complete
MPSYDRIAEKDHEEIESKDCEDKQTIANSLQVAMSRQ